MKTLLFLLLIIFSSVAFAQKSKAYTTKTIPHTLVVQGVCTNHSNLTTSDNYSLNNISLALSKKEQMKMTVMQNYPCPFHQQVVQSHQDICPACSEKLLVDRRSSKHGTSVHTCSMASDKAGSNNSICPMCGMSVAVQK